MKQEAPSLRSQRSRNWIKTALPLLILALLISVVSWWRNYPESPAQASLGPKLPLELPALEHRDHGVAAVAEARPERVNKVRAALSDWKAHQLAQDLPATPRRNISVAPPGQPPLQSPESFMTPAQKRALAQLRWQAEKNVNLRTHPEDGTVRLLTGRMLERAAKEKEPGFSMAATTARSFLRKHGAVLGLANAASSLAVHSEESDSLGFTHVKFSQMHDGVPVWPAEAMVETDKRGNVVCVTATVVPVPEQTELTPLLSSEDAVKAARSYWLDLHQLPGGATAVAPELVLYSQTRGSAPRLAWRTKVERGLLKRDTVFVDAHTGAGLNAISLVASEAVTGSGTDQYGQTQPIPLWKDNNTYWLVDTTRPMYDAQGSQPPFKLKGGMVFGKYKPGQDGKFEISGLGSTSPTAGFSDQAVSASITLGKVYEHFRTHLGRNSFDNKGHTIVTGIGLEEENAFFIAELGVMVTGDKDFYPRAVDVVAHEVVHGITATTAGLIYEFQSGALNEAFSDILAEAMESVSKGGVDPDWVLGTGLNKPFRNMKNPGDPLPGREPLPNKMSEFRNLTKDQDQGGVHVNSGIVGRAFYQLASGMTDPLGMAKAEAIFYRALSSKLQKSSNFVDSRLGCVQSAQEIHGNGSIEAQKTGQAFDFVEIFDQQAAPPPQQLPPVAGVDSTLFTVVEFGESYLGRRETALGDPVSGTYLSFQPIASGTRPCVSGDGKTVIVVTADYDAAFIDTATGAIQYFGLEGQVASVGVSANGKVYGFVFMDSFTGERDNRIDIYDDTTGQWRSYVLRAPVADGGLTDTILFADALDFTADGAIVVYDALNKFSGGINGIEAFAYSFFFLDRRTGSISSIINPNPELNVGNPSFGQRHNNLITFEADDVNRGQTSVIAIDLASRSISTLGQVSDISGPAFPSWFGNDDAVILTSATQATLYRQAITPVTLAPAGAAQAWSSGYVGTIYRRGTYQEMPRLSASLADANASEAGADPAAIRITRSGGGGEAVPFTFTVTGTAGNGTDFTRLPLSFTLPAGLTSAEIAVVPVDDNLVEGSESVTLTLADGLNYRADGTTSGTMTVADNDTGGTTFDRFMAGRGLTGADALPGADPDRDGIPNIVEGYFDLNPAASSRMSIEFRRSGENLILSWIRPEDLRGFIATPEWSPDLTTWLETAQSAAGIPSRVITVQDLGPQPGTTGHLMEARVTDNTKTLGWMHLRVTAP